MPSCVLLAAIWRWWCGKVMVYLRQRYSLRALPLRDVEPAGLTLRPTREVSVRSRRQSVYQSNASTIGAEPVSRASIAAAISRSQRSKFLADFFDVWQVGTASTTSASVVSPPRNSFGMVTISGPAREFGEMADWRGLGFLPFPGFSTTRPQTLYPTLWHSKR